MQTQYSTESPKVLYGAEAIGEYICDQDTRRVWYRLERGQIPGAFKVGRGWALNCNAFDRAIGEAA